MITIPQRHNVALILALAFKTVINDLNKDHIVIVILSLYCSYGNCFCSENFNQLTVMIFECLDIVIHANVKQTIFMQFLPLYHILQNIYFSIITVLNWQIYALTWSTVYMTST